MSATAALAALVAIAAAIPPTAPVEMIPCSDECWQRMNCTFMSPRPGSMTPAMKWDLWPFTAQKGVPFKDSQNSGNPLTQTMKAKRSMEMTGDSAEEHQRETQGAVVGPRDVPTPAGDSIHSC